MYFEQTVSKSNTVVKYADFPLPSKSRKHVSPIVLFSNLKQRITKMFKH